MHLAKYIGVQPTEIGHPRSRPHAAEESISLDQQRAATGAGGSNRSGDAGRSAAEHSDLILAVERNLPCGFFDRFKSQCSDSRIDSRRSCLGWIILAIQPSLSSTGTVIILR